MPALTNDPRDALTIDTDTCPPNVLLVRGTAAVDIVDGIPDEYLETNRMRTSDEEFAKWETEVRRLYKQMARIVISPTWAKILDFETRIPSAVEELARQQERPGE
ncbi:hypothetical protein BH24ACT9_BH24ACT9_17040 [soil metagenome]